jgi:hydroxymethylbilane synthase
MPYSINVGARGSALSRAQVDEVLRELQRFHPKIIFSPRFSETKGDLDKKTSLRDLPKDDFFTKEVDDLLLKGFVDAAIHSAKDLPEPLPKGLMLVALTKGVDPRDSLVMRHGDHLDNVSLVATSSYRREEAVLALKSGVTFCDIRGTIEERLKRLQDDIDGVVVAEAALIRLGLTSLNRVILPGGAVPMQGRLAVVAREGDLEMERIFKVLHE